MIRQIRSIDSFARNIIIVFLGSSLINFCNLLYQLLIAHSFNPGDFAAFTSLLSVFMVITAPLGTLQTAVAKYTAEFNAHNQTKKIKVFLSGFLKKAAVLALLSLVIFYFFTFYIMDKLKIHSAASGYILAMLVASSCVTPVLLGGMQGLELFRWLTCVSIVSGATKLLLAFLFILMGLRISGALGAFLAANIMLIIVCYFPLKNFLTLDNEGEDINFREVLLYLLPVAISIFCFMALISLDMVLVKYFFNLEDSGVYSLAQMLGKIFLFLPAAISVVMFPKTSGLSAKNLDTVSTLKRSLVYAGVLCVLACLGYNLFPSLTLKILTGKALPESILLGRLFSISMSFFALNFILINYFLSVKDLRFIKYLVSSTFLQVLAIALFHGSLIQVQLILCINAALLFLIHLFLSSKRAGLSGKGIILEDSFKL
jgi:O-antigen/teichoic acid export membrane protein